MQLLRQEDKNCWQEANEYILLISLVFIKPINQWGVLQGTMELLWVHLQKTHDNS